ncbi:MAG: hypothetical protein LAP86_20655 [Acidobacteriia bacterium]|nr:hypothetical protein [Terriglobia bacterium]
MSARTPDHGAAVDLAKKAYRRIAICGNCCGIATGWCRRAPDHEPTANKRFLDTIEGI